MPEHGAYSPDVGATPYDPWDIALLSERDLGIRVPVDFMTFPGVSLKAACFAHGIYKTEDAAKCLSNLLALDYKRFSIDVYWDVLRTTWGLCPAQVPNATVSSDPTAGAASSETLSAVAVSSAQLSARLVDSTNPSTGVHQALIQERQGGSGSTSAISTSGSATFRASSSTLESSASTGSLTSSISSAGATSSTVPTNIGNSTFQIGPYQCSSDLDLLFLMEVMAGFLDTTQDIVSASLVYITLHLHAAAPAEDPVGPAQEPASSALPSRPNLLSSTMNTNLSSYIYTPVALRDERRNLNDSWYNIPFDAKPITGYYDMNVTNQHIVTTQDGWPSESYIEFQEEKRLLIEFGNVDPQMQNYDMDIDNGTIFPSKYFSAPHNVTIASQATISRGCFYDVGAINISASNNNSWAVFDVQSTDLPNSDSDLSAGTLGAINNLTSCGISPFLNDTLSNKTADQDFSVYRSIPLSSIWSWAPGEPRNVSANEDDDQSIRCTVMDSTLQGHWRVENCGQEYHAACRVNGMPYQWAISSEKRSYSASADTACGEGQEFSAPRTGLENTYLFRAWQNAQKSGDSDTALWVNFNSLNQQYCWVVGVNETCPYNDQSSDIRARTVIVPTVAAVIIFVLAALTLFVKCAANRQSSKHRRRRKGEDGWDYEGVPS